MLRVTVGDPARQGLVREDLPGADGAPLITLCPAGGQPEAERGGMLAQVIA